jgi:hypothetical protein
MKKINTEHVDRCIELCVAYDIPLDQKQLATIAKEELDALKESAGEVTQQLCPNCSRMWGGFNPEGTCKPGVNSFVTKCGGYTGIGCKKE